MRPPHHDSRGEPHLVFVSGGDIATVAGTLQPCQLAEQVMFLCAATTDKQSLQPDKPPATWILSARRIILNALADAPNSRIARAATRGKSASCRSNLPVNRATSCSAFRMAVVDFPASAPRAEVCSRSRIPTRSKSFMPQAANSPVATDYNSPAPNAGIC